MQKYVQNYLEATGLQPHEVICEKCGQLGQEIHHVQHRQKNNPKLDEAENLICLCAECHREAHRHNTWENKQKLFKIINNRDML